MPLLPELRPRRTPERWEPFRELEDVTSRMRRLLEDTFGAFPGATREGGVWQPFVDVDETADAYVVELELPGIKREDVTIELLGNELAIKGETKEEARDVDKDSESARARVRRRGRFAYRTAIPADVDADRIEASMADGVLTVTVPKSAKATHRTIEITSSRSS